MGWRWKKSDEGPVTKHTCGGPKFGKLAPEGECPRCDELRNGAKPRKSWRQQQQERDEAFRRALDAHFNSEYHKSGKCGVICCYGDP